METLTPTRERKTLNEEFSPSLKAIAIERHPEWWPEEEKKVEDTP